MNPRRIRFLVVDDSVPGAEEFLSKVRLRLKGFSSRP